MVEYTAEDGLTLLTYLGILNLTDKEREVFHERWNEFYQLNKQDVISTTW